MDTNQPTPEINRRRLLLGLAAASTIGAAAAVVAVSAVTAAEIENPELVRLGDALVGIEAAYLNAAAVAAAVLAEWSPKWPAAPEALLNGCRDRDNLERDLTGQGIIRPGHQYCKSVLTAEECRDQVAYIEDVLTKTLPKAKRWRAAGRAEWEASLVEWQERHRLAVDYEQEKAAILELSAYRHAADAVSAARSTLERTVTEIMAQPESTMSGVIIKAQALAAWGKVDQFSRFFHVNSTVWGTELANAVLRLAGKAGL